jgi:hypothetical protein
MIDIQLLPSSLTYRTRTATRYVSGEAGAVQSRSKIVCGEALLALLGMLLGAYQAAVAANGGTFVLQCDTCTSPFSYESTAVQTAMASGKAGLYMVTSSTAAQTALIKVTGTRQTSCNAQGECYPTLINTTSTALTLSGTVFDSSSGTASTELSRIDGTIYGGDRQNRLPDLHVDPNYASGFVGTDPASISVAINQALGLKGINVLSIATGTQVLVIFGDGSKAVFVKNPGISTFNWVWSGRAWDANGNPIYENGTQISNPNTSGTGSGAADVGTFGAGSGLDRFSVSAGQWCAVTTTVRVNGIEVSTWRGFIPC